MEEFYSEFTETPIEDKEPVELTASEIPIAAKVDEMVKKVDEVVKTVKVLQKNIAMLKKGE